MSWAYFNQKGERWTEPVNTEITDSDVIETVGARELELLLRARRSSTGTLVLPHTRKRNAERMAARRLVERGLFGEPEAMGSSRIGWLYFYGLTQRGRTAWLRCRS